MKKFFIGITMAFACICLLCGCAENSAPDPTTVPETTRAALEETTAPVIEDVSAEAEALAEAPPAAVAVVLEPEAPGELEHRCDSAVIDYSNAADGYIMAQYTGETESRLKVLVKGPTTTYSYNLTPGQWAVFPLSDGNGSYQVGIYENVVDTKYAMVTSAEFPVELYDEFAPFLRPNQYVNYTTATQAVETGLEITAGLEDPLEKVAAIYDYVVTTLSYDYEKAETVKSGYLPDLDQVLADEKGICFDYAALMAAMLRSQEIPCKLVVGYAGQTYHAWISVWTEGDGWIDGVIFFDGQVWKRMDPTFASSQHRSEEIMDFIEHGDYTTKYLY